MRRHSATVASHRRTTDAITENSFGCQDPVSRETSPSREQVRSERDKLGLTLGVTQTGLQNQQNPNAPTFKERSTEWTYEHGRNGKESSLYFTQERV